MGNGADAAVWPLGREQLPEGPSSRCDRASFPWPLPALRGRRRPLGTGLLLASANLKNALVSLRAGRSRQLPFVSIEPGTEAVGARGPGSRPVRSLASSLLQVFLSPPAPIRASPQGSQRLEMNVLGFEYFDPFSFL